jgi:hypothetical protein
VLEACGMESTAREESKIFWQKDWIKSLYLLSILSSFLNSIATSEDPFTIHKEQQ